MSELISAIVVKKNKKEPVAQAAPAGDRYRQCTDNEHRVRLAQSSSGNDRC